MAKNIDASERLFNLTCALVFSRRGLTKREIFSSVQGYKERFDPNADQNAIDRLFDRDKNDLLNSGVQLQAEIPSEAMDDNTEYRYSIPSESVTWPAGLKLSARQVALLNLASQVWAKASISESASRAVVRLKALGEQPEESGLMGVAPTIRTHSINFPALSDAIERRQVVTFEYLKPGANRPETRSINPWSMQLIAGQWMVIGLDRNKNEKRTFLLSRFQGKVRIESGVFEPPVQRQIDDAVLELIQLTKTQKAEIRVKPDSDAWWHFNLQDAYDGVLELEYLDLHILAEELREYSTDFLSVRPQALQQAINDGLERVVSLHHA